MRYIAPVAVSVALMLAACSSDGSDESAFCQDRDQLKSSVQDLKDVNVADDGIQGLETALGVVITDTDALKASAAEYEPEVDAVKSALESLKTSVESATTDAEKVTAAVSGVTAVSTQFEALETAVGPACD